MTRETTVLDTLADLIRINSINPAYASGHPEAGIVAYIRQFFRDRGIETWEQEVFPNRPNLIAKLPGRDPNKRVVFEAHTDTASVIGMSIPPFEPTISGGRMHGRGSCDTKAGLAAMMHALASIKRDALVPPCEIWLAAAADEEHSFRGVVKLCEGLAADAAVVSEPTEMRAVIASKGVLRWKIHTRGKSAHSSKPHLGVNAINHMARVILALEEDAERLRNSNHPLVGHATCNVGVIAGGVQVNFVPDACAIEVDRRLLPGESVSKVLEYYAGLLANLQAMLPSFEAVMDPPMVVDEPLETSEHALPARLASAILKDLGLDPNLAGVPFGSDASKLSRQGIPSVLIGPGSIDQAHAAVEYVECDQVMKAFELYRRFMLQFE
jgi:acetylornithine deacetylase/succinyl-diaminopimelate desuccinylase family protein